MIDAKRSGSGREIGEAVAEDIVVPVTFLRK
jgi:hypothetical protein